MFNNLGGFFIRWGFWGLTVYFCSNGDLGVQQLGLFQIGILESDDLVFPKRDLGAQQLGFAQTGILDFTAHLLSNGDLGSDCSFLLKCRFWGPLACFFYFQWGFWDQFIFAQIGILRSKGLFFAQMEILGSDCLFVFKSGFLGSNGLFLLKEGFKSLVIFFKWGFWEMTAWFCSHGYFGFFPAQDPAPQLGTASALVSQLIWVNWYPKSHRSTQETQADTWKGHICAPTLNHLNPKLPNKAVHILNNNNKIKLWMVLILL